MTQTIKERAGAGTGVALAVAAAMVLLMAGQVSGQDAPPPPSSLSGCSADVWADYNDCLGRADSGFERYLCDADFVLDNAKCLAKEVGELAQAITG